MMTYYAEDNTAAIISVKQNSTFGRLSAISSEHETVTDIETPFQLKVAIGPDNGDHAMVFLVKHTRFPTVHCIVADLDLK